MAKTLPIILLISSIGFVVVAELLIKKGKFKRINEYSFKNVFKRTLTHLIVMSAISLLTYYLSNSFEVAICISALLFCGVIAGLFYGLLFAYQIKRRGGQKVD